MATELDYRTTLEHTIEKYRQILECYPDELSAQLALAELTHLRGLRLEALLSHQRILKSSPVPESRVALAEVYASQGLYMQAFEEISTTLRTHPLFPEAHYSAAEFSETAAIPEDLKQALEKSCRPDDLARAALQLALKRSVLLREYQELAQASERAKGDPLATYRVEETRKRLQLLERRLGRVEQLETQVAEREIEQQRLREFEQERLRQLELLRVAEEQRLREEQDILEQERLEQERLEQERLEQERLEQERLEQERLEQERLEQERLEQERLEQERLEQESERQRTDDLIDETLAGDLGQLHDFTSILDPTPAKTSAGGLGDDLEWSAHPVTAPSSAAAPSQPYFSVSTPLSEIEIGLDPGQASDSIFFDLGGDVESVDEQLRSMESGEGYPVSPTPAIQEPPAAPVQLDRSALYDKIRGEISGPIGTLAKTRGVTSIHVVARDGYVVEQSTRDAVSQERITEFVVEGLSILESFASNPQYWVLECSGGIVVFQIIDQGHVLVAVGQAGANFGALRYTMDKMRPRFALILSTVE